MEAAHEAMRTPEFQQRAAGMSGLPMANTPEQFAQQIAAMLEKYARIAKAANIRLQ